MFDSLEDRQRGGATPCQKRKQGIERLPLPRLVALPSCRCSLPNDAVKFQREPRSLFLGSWTYECRCRKGGQVVKQYGGFRLAVQHRRDTCLGLLLCETLHQRLGSLQE